MDKIFINTLYEVTFLDIDQTVIWSGATINKELGKAEAHEALNGYAPNIVIIAR